VRLHTITQELFTTSGCFVGSGTCVGLVGAAMNCAQDNRPSWSPIRPADPGTPSTCAWRHADLVGLRSIFTHHVPIVWVPWLRVARRRDALAVWVKPVVIVGEGTYVVAAVLSHQRIVRVRTPQSMFDTTTRRHGTPSPRPVTLTNAMFAHRLDVVYAGIDSGWKRIMSGFALNSRSR